jgi:predicted nucleic acid-binding protein
MRDRPLFDASALMNIVRLLGAEALDHVKGGYELSLTPYEVGNAIWKEALLMKRVSLEEALALVEQLSRIHEYLEIVEPHESVKTFMIAYKLGITYYDASYIATASKLDTPLITDDKKLVNSVKSNMNTLKGIIGKEIEVFTSRQYTARK